VPVGDPPPEPELLDEELLLDAELLDAELLDAELLDAELLLDAVLVPVPIPPAPPLPPALLVELLVSPPALLVEALVPPPALLVEVDVELGEDDSWALDAPPEPSSVPAAQLDGAVAMSTEPAATRVREATRRPTRAGPDAKKDRGNIPRASITRPARAATFAGFWRNLPGLV
jgi:hypothetical protein